MGRTLAMFTSGAAQTHRITTQSVVNAYNAAKQGNMKGFYANLRNAFLSHAVMGLAYAFAENGFMLDPEKKKRKNKMTWGILLGSAQGLFAVGRALSGLQAIMTDAPWADKSSLAPVFDTFNGLVSSLSKGLDAHKRMTEFEDSAKEKARIERNEYFSKAAKYLSQMIGIQVKQVFDIYEDANEVLKGESAYPVRQALGLWDPEYSSGVRLIDTFDEEEWDNARQEAAVAEKMVMAGASREKIQEKRKELREK
jgi:hypothetical protein